MGSCAICGNGPIGDTYHQYNMFRWYTVQRGDQRFTFTDGSVYREAPGGDLPLGIRALIHPGDRVLSHDGAEPVIDLCRPCERIAEMGSADDLARRSWREVS